MRVCVIGAGVGGLAAARELKNNGYDVVVVERAARAGGKVHTVHMGDSYNEAGAMRILDSQHTLLKIIQNLNLTVSPFVEENPNALFTFNGVSGRLSDMGVGTLVKSGLLEASVAQAAGLGPGWAATPFHVILEGCFSHPDVHAWLDGRLAQYLERPVEQSDLAARNKIGKLILDLRNGKGGMHNIVVVREFLRILELHSGQPQRVDGGLGTLVDALVSVLTSKGDGGDNSTPSCRVLLGHEVKQVVLSSDNDNDNDAHDDDDDDTSPVTVRCRVNGDQGTWKDVQADAVLVTSGCLRNVQFQPALPQGHQAAVDGATMQNAIKVLLRFSKRFWEEEDEGGNQALTGGVKGGCSWVYPGHIPQIYYPPPIPGHADGILMVYIRGPLIESQGWMHLSQRGREDRCLASIERLHGKGARALFVESSTSWWTEPGVGAYSLQGVDTFNNAVAQPAMDGRLFFAGLPRGWVNDACEDAIRAAGEIIKAWPLQ